MRPPLVLTIADSQSDGAAGIQADLKTFTALGVYGASAVSMITAVSTRGVRESRPLPGPLLRTQIDAVAEDLWIDATKIGALGSAENVDALAQALTAHRSRLGRIVLDPVMVAADGTALITAEGARAIGEQLLQMVDVLTLTMAEAAQLLGEAVAPSIEQMREHALALQARGPATVLITGGLLEGEDVVDVLVHPGGTDLLRAQRVPGRRVRGAGTTLSAAIAAQLARIAEFDRAGELEEIGEPGTDDDMITIIASAREFLASATENARDWQISRSADGHGPVNHLITLDNAD
ncbi:MULTISPECIES: hydroxymethylpyrimidine/phosphomethylpyrimidine kinase [unclassified Brachybacterium]|uniref:bifunctional hydroxymethylpyrimidine kinase/phosphomethylpyrimidine kinase n=1 Tax=unclassified Brachybacterium TaxID=2623841 RepID=UPI000C80EBBA|nr:MULTISPECIES: hydroxymethylpyrimidine/phosphomethylpyrimidine kinase [unclassified Brachybacterium]PMC75587.1 hydroxymethylpyrimidine/phosphomethylpyrimidine kinase [Brachybacterium sp. UMB0905]